jgi:hypothetical protein
MVEPISDDCFTVFRQDGFGMELKAANVEVAMPSCHYRSLVIKGGYF